MWLTRHERELRRGSDEASELRWVCAVTDNEGNEDDAGVTTETQ